MVVQTESNISGHWKIFPAKADSIYNLRAIDPKNKKPVINKIFKASDYSTIDELQAEFAVQARQLNSLGYNIYIVMNPIKASFSGNAVSDSDIATRDVLLVDIDRAGSRANPATDAELHECKIVADQVVEWFKKEGEEPIAKVMSGNGYHIYYQLSLPNDNQSTQLVKALLNQLAAKFNNGKAEVDTAVYNASRITKVIGTISRKGAESVDRPFRRSYLC